MPKKSLSFLLNFPSLKSCESFKSVHGIIDREDELAQRVTAMRTPPVSINKSRGFSGCISDKHFRQVPNCFTAQVKGEAVIDSFIKRPLSNTRAL